jgi:hypothetical protein
MTAAGPKWSDSFLDDGVDEHCRFFEKPTCVIAHGSAWPIETGYPPNVGFVGMIRSRTPLAQN